MIIQARLTKPMGIIIAYLIMMPFGFANVNLGEGCKLVTYKSGLSDAVQYVLIYEAIVHFGGKIRCLQPLSNPEEKSENKKMRVFILLYS